MIYGYNGRMTLYMSLGALLDQINPLHQFIASFIAESAVPTQIYRADGRSVYVNQAFLDMFGVAPPAEYSVLEDEIAEKTGVLSVIKLAFKGESVKLPVTWYNPSDLKIVKVTGGNKVAMESRAQPVFNEKREVTHVVFTFNDVTLEQIESAERQKVVKQLNDANSLMRDLLNETKAIIYFKDLDSKYLLVNKQLETIFNLESGFLLGKTAEAFQPHEFSGKMRENDLAVLKSGVPTECEEVTLHRDGSLHTYISLKFPLKDSEGKIYGVCGISTDISQIRKIEQELSAARRMESLGVLAGGVAHDFNNILGVILMHADGLPGAEVIATHAERASQLTRKLLAFGRGHTSAPVILNLNTTIQGLRDILSRVVGADIALEVSFEKSLGAIKADPTQMEQILMNLCLNARDAMVGGGKLSISTRNVSLTSSREGRLIGARGGSYVELSVTDTGHGISKEVAERVFEPFFSTKEKDKGTGLGLSSVYGIVQQCGGDIELISEPGQGASFRVYFPIVSGSEAVVSSSESKVDQECKKQSILIIDDEAALREVTAEVLRNKGYIVHDVERAPQAEDVLRDTSKNIDLIISDVIMPNMSGPMLIADLTKKGLLERKKVLFVSGYSDNKLEGSGLPPDRTAFLMKPYTVKVLLEKIRAVLDAPE
jgi:PAS domain S-box-containing protein